MALVSSVFLLNTSCLTACINDCLPSVAVSPCAQCCTVSTVLLTAVVCSACSPRTGGAAREVWPGHAVAWMSRAGTCWADLLCCFLTLQPLSLLLLRSRVLFKVGLHQPAELRSRSSAGAAEELGLS